MAQYSGFFNGELKPDGTFDRIYLAKSFAAYFSSFIGNGIFPTPPDNSGLLVTAGTGEVSVAAGQAYINGYWYRNSEALILALAPYSGTVREDAIVVRWSDVSRDITLAVVQNYTAPTRTETQYELVIATVLTSASGITVQDTRLDTTLCGLVKTLLSEGGGEGDITLKADKIALPDGGYKNLVDVENELFSEIETRTSEDTRIQNAATAALQAYRTAAEQDTIDTGKVTKQSFTDTTTNPNGFVLLWLQPNFSANAVSINYAAMQPLTGQFTPGTVALPFADSSKAGIMTKEQAAAIEQNSNDIANLIAGSGFEERWFDTRAELQAADVLTILQGTPTVVWNDEGQGGATTKWKYAPADASGREKVNGFIYGGIAQEVPYTVANTTTLGLVLSSTEDGKGNIEPNGVISVEGWDALVARVTALEQWKEQQLAFNTSHNHSGGAQGVVLQKQFTVYTSDAQAIADTSHNQALSPLQGT